MKKHSTGALNNKQRSIQDKKYTAKRASAVIYDYLLIGTGNAVLTCASLLANKGFTVCLLEAHDVPGGYAHTFTAGDYSFCAQVHYIWGCGKGGKIFQFLKKIALEKEISFELFSKEGYDHMIMPDGKRVKIPYGWETLQKNIEEAYPDTTGLTLFIETAKEIRKEIKRLPKKIQWWDLLLKRSSFPFLI